MPFSNPTADDIHNKYKDSSTSSVASSGCDSPVVIVSSIVSCVCSSVCSTSVISIPDIVSVDISVVASVLAAVTLLTSCKMK